MLETKLYVVTEAAGEWIAGVRRPQDGIIRLTRAQAAHPLRLGHITPYEPKKPASGRRKRKDGVST